jgi:zinc transport system substrate-binding protein
MSKTNLPLITGILLMAVSLFSAPSQAGLKVVVSIMPIHSLVAGLMNGVTEPYLLLKGNQSPHTMTLKPSDARALNDADLIVWVGETLESPLARLLHRSKGHSEVVSLLAIPDMTLLPIRDTLDWVPHEHHDHYSATADPHTLDSHIWLSPENARIIVRYLTGVLTKLDPSNADLYQRNSQMLLLQIDNLEVDFAATIATVKEVAFIVFHDAYHYLENHFGLNAVGSVSVSPERPPGAKRIHDLRERIRRLDARCVFSEPQFEPKLVNTLVEGTPATAGELDPLGGHLTAGTEAYFHLMRRLSENLLLCLGRGQ